MAGNSSRGRLPIHAEELDDDELEQIRCVQIMYTLIFQVSFLAFLGATRTSLQSVCTEIVCLPPWLGVDELHIHADWIQDSILERNRRLRNARTIYSSRRGPNGEVTIPWLWTQFRKAVDTGQSWIVVSIVGKSTINLQDLFDSPPLTYFSQVYVSASTRPLFPSSQNGCQISRWATARMAGG
jgi:hypothetical protein